MDNDNYLVSLVHLEDSLEHFPFVEQLVVLGSILDRSRVLDEALEQVVVFGEKLDSRVEDCANWASTELESQVLVVKIQTFQFDGVSVDAARRDNAEVADDLDGKLECRLSTDDLECNISTSTLGGFLEPLDRIIVREVERDGAVFFGFRKTLGHRIDSVDRLEERTSSSDGTETDRTASDHNSCHILSLSFVEHGVGVVSDKVARGEDVGGKQHDLFGHIFRDRVQRRVCEWNEDVLCLRTVERNRAKDTRFGASPSLTAIAEEAVTARDGERRDNLVALLPVLDSSTRLMDLTDKFVTEDKVVLGDRLVTTVDVQVRTTKGGQVDLDHDFALPRLRNGALENSDLLGALDDDGLHGGRGGHIERLRTCKSAALTK